MVTARAVAQRKTLVVLARTAPEASQTEMLKCAMARKIDLSEMGVQL
ncbi:MAG: hypothetical protein WDN76_03310 [Alphaproteobacteria bacterium]